ncbi:MAG: sugar phosphate nucleotidyltransferase [Candidatus Neomarinimicrobiota bacterium]
MNVTSRVDAIVLGGGRGARLWPLTRERAKPAVQIGGKHRLIDIPLSNCINSNIKHIRILTQFNTASLHRHIFQTYTFDIFSRGNIELLAAQQTLENATWFQGTADAVRSYWERFVNLPTTHFIILAGDHLYRMDYREFFQAHLDAGADVTIALKAVLAENSSEFGIAKCDSSARVIDFLEKPASTALADVSTEGWVTDEHALASMGIYIFNKDVLNDALKMDGDDFGREIIPAVVKKYDTFGYQFHDYWVDIGTIGAFYEANMDLAGPAPEFEFYSARDPIYTRPRFLPGSRVSNAKIVDSVVSEGCIVGKSEIRHSILGMRSIVGNGVSLDGVYAMGADFYESEIGGKTYPGVGIGDNSILRKTILDKNVKIGKNVVLENRANAQKEDGDFYSIREGIIVIPKDTVIPDGTIV